MGYHRQLPRRDVHASHGNLGSGDDASSIKRPETLTSTARTTGIGLIPGILLRIGLGDAVHRWPQSSLRNASVLAIIAGAFLFASAVAALELYSIFLAKALVASSVIA